MLILKEIFEWTDHPFRRQCWADVEVYSKNGKYLLIVTERDDNGGSSITNSAENLWPQLIKSIDASPNACTCIEHYVHSNSETWDVVEIVNGNACWTALGPDKFKKLFDQYKD